jgi:hypothetical protein
LHDNLGASLHVLRDLGADVKKSTLGERAPNEQQPSAARGLPTTSKAATDLDGVDLIFQHFSNEIDVS